MFLQQTIVNDLVAKIKDDELKDQLQIAIDRYFAVEEVQRVAKHIMKRAESMSDQEARFLVDGYYAAQENRKRYRMQKLSLQKAEKPYELMDWLEGQTKRLEDQILRGLDAFTQCHPMGAWMREIYGVGPVIAGGTLAYLDITRAETVAAWWAYAGLAGDNQKKWEKGGKRPYSVQLKSLLWNAGQCFMKFSNNPECDYGKVYKFRKSYEIARNERGGNAARAAQILLDKKWDPSTEAFKHYSAGRLPPAHIDAQARRYTVKLFLSHLHFVWYFKHHGILPPMPYVIAIMGHADYILPPNTYLIEGLDEAMEKAALHRFRGVLENIEFQRAGLLAA